ncbi:MAG: aminotransferase class I/II-fold pyridoxal phosphate-dependent enzyme, partial [Solirubrobacteraceae bacterium]
ALHSCAEIVDERVRRIREERPRLIAGLRERGFEVSDSQANFVWGAHPGVSGAELAVKLERAGILVAAGDALGEPGRTRIAIHSAAATDRLLNALENVL